MRHLLLVLILGFLTSCAKEEEDSLSNKYRSCNGVDPNSVQYCINFDDTNLNAAEKKAFCDSVTSGSLSESDCSSVNSNGVCSAVTISYANKPIENLKLRFYLGNAILEEAGCTGFSGTWTVDTGGLVIKQSVLFCESNGSCLKLNGISSDNAENFCNQINGYLENNCE